MLSEETNDFMYNPFYECIIRHVQIDVCLEWKYFIDGCCLDVVLQDEELSAVNNEDVRGRKKYSLLFHCKVYCK